MRAKIYDWKSFDEEGTIDVECDVEMCVAISCWMEAEIRSAVDKGDYDKAQRCIEQFQVMNEKIEEYEARENAKCESTENAG